jgi:hypothetical protein
VSEHSLLPLKAITPELLSAYSQFERDKHAECHGHCKHARESAEVSGLLCHAFTESGMIQDRVDRQLAKTFEHAKASGDVMNSFRTFAVAMIVQGWELAAFSLEGKDADNQFGVQ